MKPESIQQFTGSLHDSLNLVWAKILTFLPKFVGALLIVALGYALAIVAQKALTAILRKIGLDRLVSKLKADRFLERIGSSLTASVLIGKVVFWAIFLIALMAAAETMGLRQASESIDVLVQFLPKVIAAILLLLFGMFVAGFLRKTVTKAAAGMPRPSVSWSTGLSRWLQSPSPSGNSDWKLP